MWALVRLQPALVSIDSCFVQLTLARCIIYYNIHSYYKMHIYVQINYVDKHVRANIVDMVR